MKLYFEFIKLLFNKIVKREDNGIVIRKFCEKMGITYIKFAQMLATQNYGNLFTENDRKLLSSICDNCNPIPFEDIRNILEKEYGKDLDSIFTTIDHSPIGSASISQVHKAFLKNGEVVAIKVKRKDITDSIEKDIEQMKKIVHKFGRFVNFKNFIGGDKALELYLTWIYEETDFVHEKENIKIYQNFAKNINGEVNDTKNIKVPKLYEEFCTENVIVMEYVENKTINKMELNDENNEKISIGLNSYIKSSIYALLNDKKIVFHGDPHGGNIYLDKDNNIGFLDMGLLFVLSDEDSKLTKQFFLNAYSGNYEKLYNLLLPYIKTNEEDKIKFKEEVKKYCDEVKSKDVTYYFTDMINICLKYEFLPPNFLFCMAKAFVCLNGINGFSNNLITATELLQEQVVEFFIKRSLEDNKKLIINSIKFAPNFLKSTYKYGLVKGITKERNDIEKLNADLKDLLDHYKEILDIIGIERENKTKTKVL